jgi:bifunctional non-homologous end joining protein LigD
MKTALPSIELAYREGSSDKVYRAAVEAQGDGFVVNFAYGRRGATLNVGSKTQSPVSYDEAAGIYEKLVKSKTAKGYKPAGGGPAGGTGMSIAEERQDTGLRAQLLNPITEDEVERYLKDPDWCAQEKYDGRRMLIRKAGGQIIAANRNGLSMGMPADLAGQLATVQGDFVIDGECIGERFYAFDLLENLGGDWRQSAYQSRHQALRSMLSGVSDNIVVAETAWGSDKGRLLGRLKAEGKEGIVFKHLRAPWHAGRLSNGCALKLKFWSSCSCVVARVNGKRSVELALGGVGIGNVTIPANQEIPVVGQVVEVRYLYVNGVGGALYQPVCLGVRDDVPAAECTAERQRLKYKAGED